MRLLNIVMVIIEQGGLYHLEFRNGPKRIGAAGLVGCFGGKIEQGEEPLRAICREVKEETNLNPVEADFVRLGEVDVIADNNLEPVKIHATVYKLILSKGIDVEAHEGRLVSLTESEAKRKVATMTPGTQAAFNQFIFGDKNG
jgi:8-oxo-dGTP pyrophosphatase MutT (NUDIX family)